MSMRHWVVSGLLLLVAGVAAAAERDFTLSGVDGVTHSLSEYRGKWVVVNFWATWCSPCLEEIPELIRFHARHKDRDAVVLGVAWEDIGAAQLRAFVTRHGMNYPVLMADPAADPPLSEVPALPTTFIVSPKGELLARQVGPVTATQLESYIRRKSRASPPQAGQGGASAPAAGK